MTRSDHGTAHDHDWLAVVQEMNAADGADVSSGEALPDRLDVLRDLVNTLDVEGGTDALDEPSALARWCADRGLLRADVATTAADLEQVRAVREALREALAANHDGGPVSASARRTLHAVADRARLTLRCGSDGRMVLVPGSPGVDGALGVVLAIAERAVHTGSWARLKVCRGDDCLWAFYDASRNRSGKWCSMAVCGNRAKVRAFRARQHSS